MEKKDKVIEELQIGQKVAANDMKKFEDRSKSWWYFKGIRFALEEAVKIIQKYSK